MARLPVPGSDDGTWGTVLNDFLSQSLDSTGSLKPGTVGASQVTDGALPQAKITNLTSTLAAKVDTTDVRLANQNGFYPPQGYGFFAMTVPPETTNFSSTFSNLFLCRIWIPAGNAIAKAGTLVVAGGTVSGGGTNGFALYDDSGTLITSTLSDDNLFTSTGWVTASFSTPVAAQSTGRFVYVGLMSMGYASSSTRIMYNRASDNPLWYGGNGVVNRRLIFDSSTTDFPASFTPATFGGNTQYMPLIGLA